MPEIIGKQIELGLAVENVRGTSPSQPEVWLRNVTANVIAKAEKVVDESKRGQLEDSENARVVKKWYQGEVEGVLAADPIGYFFYNLYGIANDTTVTTGVYSHVFTLQNSIQHASLSLFAKDGGAQQAVFKNGMLTSLEITASPDDLVRFSAEFMAAGEGANASSPSYENTQYDFIGKDVSIKLADTEAGLTGATAISAKSLSVKWDVGAIIDYVLGSYSPDDIYNAKMSIEGEFVLNFSGETYKDLFLGDTDKYMQITIAGTADIGGGNYPTITILFNKVKVMDWNRDGGNDELVTETISFKAFYNDTDGQQSKVTLKNKTAEYDTAPTA